MKFTLICAVFLIIAGKPDTAINQQDVEVLKRLKKYGMDVSLLLNSVYITNIKYDPTKIPVGDAELDELLTFKDRFTYLSSSSEIISSKGFLKLAHFTKLETLILTNSQFDDTSAEIIPKLKNLRLLDLTGSKITGKTIKKIIHLKGLRDLELTNTQIKDEDLIYLEKIRTLEAIKLNNTKVTDKGVEILANMKLPKLTNLELDNTAITDEGARHITKMKGLSYVSLINTKIKNHEQIQNEIYNAMNRKGNVHVHNK